MGLCEQEEIMKLALSGLRFNTIPSVDLVMLLVLLCTVSLSVVVSQKGMIRTYVGRGTQGARVPET